MEDQLSSTYDAILVVSFGGPEGPQDVLPFLENVLRGKNVPRERMLEVAEHYHHFGGRSPINDQNRALIATLKEELQRLGPHLPVYWGNRNWHPLLPNTVRQMANDGVKRALAFVTSAFGSYSGCRQYLEDIERARQAVGDASPVIDKIRLFYNHPVFIAVMQDRVQAALQAFPAERRAGVPILYTAHSVPVSMAQASPYEEQLREACRLVSEGIGRQEFTLVYQSRSGPPSQPWLEPDVREAIRSLHAAGQHEVVVVPIGFLSDHMEVLYDLDTEAQHLCQELGMTMVRAGTASGHPQFAAMVRELIVERLQPEATARCVGRLGAWPNTCAPDCCPAPRRPSTAHPGGTPA